MLIRIRPPNTPKAETRNITGADRTDLKSARESSEDVWGKLASRADLGVNADTLSDPLLYSLFERKDGSHRSGHARRTWCMKLSQRVGFSFEQRGQASKMHRKLAAAMRRAGDAHHAALELELSRAWQTWWPDVASEATGRDVELSPSSCTKV